MNVTGGATDVTTYVVLRTAADNTETTGATITAIDLQYVRSGAAPSAKVDATALAAIDSAHGDNKAFEVDATDAPGLYRVDWPDAAFAAGVPEVILTVKLASSFTAHLAVEIDAPVNVTKWLGTTPLGLSNQRVQVDVQAIDGFADAATVLGWWLTEGVAPIADSGTTTTLIDAMLTQADGHWNGALLIFRSGTNKGRTVIITDFDAATDTLTFTPALPDAVTTEGYVLVPGLGWSDVQAIAGTAQRATDLAEIARYLFANSVTLTDIIDDNSVFAQMLATSGDISGYASVDDAQQSIRDAIAAAAPIPYHPDASSAITVGSQGATTYADASSDNGTPWTIGDENGSPTIDVTCEFNMGANRSARSVEVNGYYNRSGAGGYLVEIYAYNYTSAAWDKISQATPTHEMRDRASDTDYVLALSTAHTDPVTTPGEVKIRFQSTRDTTAGGDVLYLDHVEVKGVAAGGNSPAAISDAVWEHDIFATATENSAGYFLRYTRLLVTDVATGDTTTSFTLSGGCTVNDCYNGMLLMLEDETDDHYEVRRIVDWTSGLVITVDRAFGFTPAPGDHAYIMATGYADVNTTHVAATAQTARDIGASVLLSSGSGTGQLSVASGVVKSNLAQILGTALTETGGYIAAAFKKLFNVATPVLTAASANQTGNNYTRLGAPAGASIAADIAGIAGDASAANQTLILEDLVDIKGTGFVKDTNSLVDVTGGAITHLSVTGQDITIEDSSS